jgi:hypothetical protein
METHRMEVERIDVISTKPFAEVVATLERLVPIADISVIQRMIASRCSAQEIKRAQRISGEVALALKQCPPAS